VAALFTSSELTVETVADFHTAAWEKLLSNVTANPLTALTGRRAEVLREPAVARPALDLLNETVSVAGAEGARLCDDAAARMLDWLQALPPTASTSMLQDRQAGRPSEHNGLLGPVVEGGIRHAIPTPASRTILALLSALPTATTERSRWPQRKLGTCPTQRVERMARLLATTDLSIAETARSVGWTNQFHASRCFHAAYGVSPTEYRRQLPPPVRSLRGRTLGRVGNGAGGPRSERDRANVTVLLAA
jgi:hypothetical protein